MDGERDFQINKTNIETKKEDNRYRQTNKPTDRLREGDVNDKV